MEVFIKLYPSSLEAERFNDVRLIIRVKNDKKGLRWFEADIEVPHKLSLTPDHSLRKGKIRIGILRKNEVIEKYIRIFGSKYTKPDIYKAKITVFAYDRNGVINERVDKEFEIECKPVVEEIIK